MTTRIEFFVPGEPKGNARHRTTKGGHSYTPADTKSKRAEVAFAYLEAARSRKPHEGPVGLGIVAHFPPRASWPKWKRALLDESSLPCTTKPDLDNIAKLVMDALNGVAFRDDSQVHTMAVSKLYDTRTPGMHVRLDLHEPASREPR